MGICGLNEIKKDQRLNKIPVIMYSTFSQTSEIEKYKALDAGFLVKQNNYHDLVAALRKVLGKG
jgi:DNA-binding NarL/FixJ family response regulator